MRLGYRVLSPQEVGRLQADLLQISLYSLQGLQRAKETAREAQRQGIPYVLHPVGFSLPQALPLLRQMAPWAGEALILHDARARDGGRLGGAEEQAFREALGELSALVRVSFENATFSPDAPWFWQQFAQSITLDVGHLEAAGLDSLGFVRALPQGLLQRVEYVHLHRNASLRGGLTDHWPITASCRELQAVRALLEHKPQVALILEINETEELEANLRLLRDVLP